MRATGLISLGDRPPLWREARIGLEVAALLRDPIFRGDGMVDGRGRPVLLIPGFLAGDGSLSMMAGWLKRAGYRPSRAGIVANVNCAGTLLPRLEDRLERLVSEQGQRAAIVGQSRGGTLAKVLAHRRPDLVTGVVALGSPQIDPLAVHPLVRLQVEAVGRLGSLGAPGLFKRSCIDGDCCSSFWEHLAQAAAARHRPSVGVLEERRRGRLALLPRPARHAARRDPGLPLRDGRVEIGLARRRGGAGGLPGCRAAPAYRHRGPAASPSRRLSAAQGTSTAEPRKLPSRRRLSASFACSRAKGSTCVRTGTVGASARNSSASARVRLATERSTRSPQSSS